MLLNLVTRLEYNVDTNTIKLDKDMHLIINKMIGTSADSDLILVYAFKFNNPMVC